MTSRTWSGLAVTGALALGVAACGSNSSGSGSTINGSGSTFAAPVYQQWGSNVRSQDGITVNYQAVGSGQGVSDFTAGTVDFGASDAALKDSEVKAAQAKGTPVHVPTFMGSVTLAYNLSGIKSGLKLQGSTVADIFLGKVTKWNDPAITSLNPGVNLPSQNITVVHRSDSSGTTKLFTTFVADYSPQWSSQVGADKTVKWPTGTGAKGNDGVAAAIKQTPGALGYVEQAYALANNFTVASVQNRSGQYVAPSTASTAAAGKVSSLPADLRFNTINSAVPGAYPIASVTFALVYQDMCKAGISQGNAKDVKTFLDYGLGAGQQVVQQLHYSALPPNILNTAKQKVSGLQCNGQPLS